MEKLDENYLDLVRESLYKKQPKLSTQHIAGKSKNSKKLTLQNGNNDDNSINTVKKGFKTKQETFKAKAKLRKKLKKKPKPKQVTFTDITSNNEPENDIPQEFYQDSRDSSNKIENRVSTPFKIGKAPVKIKTNDSSNLNKQQDDKLVSIVTEQINPSLRQNDELTFYPSTSRNINYNFKEPVEHNNIVRSKKRLLSDSDSPIVTVKKKKKSLVAGKGNRLVFDDSLEDSDLAKMGNKVLGIGEKQKKIHQKKKFKNKALKSEDKLMTTLTTLEDKVGSNNPNTVKKHKEISVKKENKKKYLEWENNVNTTTLDISLENETETRFNNTWENFVYSIKSTKNQSKTEKVSNKLKNKSVKTDSNKLVNEKTKNVKNILKLNKPSNLGKLVSKKHAVAKSHVISSKLLNNKDRTQGNKIKKLVPLKDAFTVRKKSKNLNASDCSIEEDLSELSDSCDNETVGVKGLKFQRFCNLFPTTYNEQYLGLGKGLHIPKKYFKFSKNDLVSDWQTEELSITKSKKVKHSGKEMFSASGPVKILDFADKSKSNESYGSEDKLPASKLELSNSLSNKKKKNEEKVKINVIDIKIINPTDSLQNQDNSPGIINTQETVKSNLEENIRENLNETYEEVDNNLSIRIQDNLGNSNNKIILTLKNENKIVALNMDEKIYVHGLCSLKVLHGRVEILGRSLNNKSGVKKLYSPRGTALLYIKNKATLYVEGSIKLKDLVSEDLLQEKDIEFNFAPHYALFLCTELKEPYVDFIETYIPQKIFPEGTSDRARVDFKLQGGWNMIYTSEKWDKVLEDIRKDSKVVISGGKGVGKSTFLRYAINFLLENFKKVRVIDLDPGQSEFYAPGCISVVTVQEEVFGPNYTHLLKPDILLLSHINMGYDIKKYLKSVQILLEMTKPMEVLPTLINFPGYTQGLGLDISAQSLNWVQPSSVIQINSKNPNKNYRIDITAENIGLFLKEKTTLNQEVFIDNTDFFYNFVVFESLSETNNGAWSLEARQAREINILSYFGQMMSKSVTDLISPDVNMYSISISALSITNAEGKPLSPLAINANLVALCSILDSNSCIFSCYGYGFVRGIDLQTDTLVLITPESIETLTNVTHLVLSSVTTPPSLIMTAGDVKGHIPYVSVGDPVDFGQFTKRSYLPPRK